MKTKTLINKQLKRKTNPKLVKTIILSKKNEKWAIVSEILSGPRKNRINLNLGEINEKAKDKEKVVVIGKVLSQGNIEKKIKIIAFDFSERTREKLLKSGSEFSTIAEEIKKNPEAKNIKFLEKGKEIK